MKVLIIGNGIAGITCARHLRKRDKDVRITVISSERPHFFSRPALMYVYMGHMGYNNIKPYADSFWKKNDIDLIYDHVTRLDVVKKRVFLRDASCFVGYDSLVLALGSVSRFMDWEGVSLRGVQGLYSYPDLERMEKNTRGIRQGVVVGGGLIGIEVAEMLHSRGISVIFLVREASFWNNILPEPESQMINRHILQQGIDLRVSTELSRIEGREGKVCAVHTSHNERIACDFVSITIGVSPNISLLQGTPISTHKGICVDEYLQTSQADVYAIGDCAEVRAPLAHRRAIEPVWYTGRMMGETLARTLVEKKPMAYRPGVWFNSAKFFDIEYQTYGQVDSQMSEQHASLYWESPTRSLSLRIVFDRKTHSVVGCNALGVRQRHVVWEAWIRQKTPLKEVVSGLKTARFDSEFAYAYEKHIQDLYHRYRRAHAVSVS